MLRSWTERPLADLLAAHGLSGSAEEPFPNDGWSGATLTRLARERDGRPFILKRSSWASDWIARATRDHALREGFVASMPLPVAEPLVAPYHGAAADGTSVAILMPDLTGRLLAWEAAGPESAMSPADLDRVLGAVARLHAMPWPIAERTDAAFVWPSAPLRERLLLLSPRSSARLARDGVAAGERFVAGWAAFERLASAGARALIERLDREPRLLLRALAPLPLTTLHGDLKFANVAFLGNEAVALIDWQMTMLAPIAVELGWLLVSNSADLPEGPESVLERYRRFLTAVARSPLSPVKPFEPTARFEPAVLQSAIGAAGATFRSEARTVGDWDLQTDLVWIVGLMLRGWRKGLDAEAGVTLASGVTAREDLAWWCDRAVEAAARRLPAASN